MWSVGFILSGWKSWSDGLRKGILFKLLIINVLWMNKFLVL